MHKKYKTLLKAIVLTSAISGVLFLISCTCRPLNHYDITFKTTACIKPYSEFTYKLGKPLNINIDGEDFTIPAGFETDLASIPRWYWMVLAPQYSAFMEPSIVHDYFYRCANYKTRGFADDVFYYALLKKGVSRKTASQFYLAVRMFGAHSYTKSLPCDQEERTAYA